MLKFCLALVLSVALLSLAVGCGGKAASEGGKKMRVVCTVYPVYDWARAVIGKQAGEVELVLLQKGSVDMHSFKPSAKDMMLLGQCDLFVYVGGESDAWAEAALAAQPNPRRRCLKLFDVLGEGVKAEAPVAGAQKHEHDHDHDHDHDGHHHGEEAELDEHVWLSLRHAERCCLALAKALGEADGVRAEEYRGNADAYAAKLRALDQEFQAMARSAKRKSAVFGDRFPFRYLADDYGLECFAAFQGCSAESEASFQTIKFLAEKADSLGVPCILRLEGTRNKIAETVVGSTRGRSLRILTLDSMQSLPEGEADAGPGYLERMRRNLEVLREALN